MFGPRCVVVCWWWCHLLTGFGCGQLPLRPVHSLRRLKCAPARSQHRCFTSLLPSFGLPCGSASIRALSFVAAPLDCASPLGRASSSHLLSRGGIPTTRLAPPSVAFHACALARYALQALCLGFAATMVRPFIRKC